MNPTEIERQKLVNTQEKQTETKEGKLDRLIEAGSNPARSILAPAAQILKKL
jgi:hypothetical protein